MDSLSIQCFERRHKDCDGDSHLVRDVLCDCKCHQTAKNTGKYKTLLKYTHPVFGTKKCDANCYNAEMPDCDCVCGGRNHGIGFTQARINTTEHGHEMISDYMKKLEAMLDNTVV